ncbi:coiled-coil domain-containing protein mad1 [Trifolium repens]|nr:coiled-coil domain-containing protein mad1 [Trifolium repens]
MDIEFLELQARDTLQNICTGPISNASFVRLSISVKSIWKIVDLFVMEFCSGILMDEIKAKFHRHPNKLSLEQMECRANNAEKEAELLKEQLDHLKDQFNECLHQKTEVEKKLATFSSQEVSSTGSNVLVKQLQQELQHYESEVREARKLRSNHENVELLKEKLLEEKSRRERAESELSKLYDVQSNVKKLEDQISSWRLMIKDIPLCDKNSVISG